MQSDQVDPTESIPTLQEYPISIFLPKLIVRYPIPKAQNGTPPPPPPSTHSYHLLLPLLSSILLSFRHVQRPVRAPRTTSLLANAQRRQRYSL